MLFDKVNARARIRSIPNDITKTYHSIKRTLRNVIKHNIERFDVGMDVADEDGAHCHFNSNRRPMDPLGRLLELK